MAVESCMESLARELTLTRQLKTSALNRNRLDKEATGNELATPLHLAAGRGVPLQPGERN